MKTIVIGVMPPRTLKTMSRYGLVELQREKTHVRPVVKATEFRILAVA